MIGLFTRAFIRYGDSHVEVKLHDINEDDQKWIDQKIKELKCL